MNQQLTLTETIEEISQKVADGSTLAAMLITTGRWMTRKEIATALGWKERRIRAAGEYSGGKVIFGQKGMCNIACATIDETMTCKNTLFSQSRRNAERACEIMRAYHRFSKKNSAV